MLSDIEECGYPDVKNIVCGWFQAPLGFTHSRSSGFENVYRDSQSNSFRKAGAFRVEDSKYNLESEEQGNWSLVHKTGFPRRETVIIRPDSELRSGAMDFYRLLR